MSSSYRYKIDGVLSAGIVHDNSASAIAEGMELAIERGLPRFVIEEVRPAKLSDFIAADFALGDIRERMAEVIGDDSACDTDEMRSKFGPAMAAAADAFAEANEIQITGWIVVRSKVVLVTKESDE